MPAVRKTRLMSAVWRIHPHLYRISRGKIGGRIGALEVLVLTTVGRSSGKRRAVALMGFDDGDRIVVCGSNAGEPHDPAWVGNLRVNPEATVERGALLIDVTAHEARGDERARLWTRLLEFDPGYAEYAQRTTRTLPIVVLSARSRLADLSDDRVMQMTPSCRRQPTPKRELARGNLPDSACS